MLSKILTWIGSFIAAFFLGYDAKSKKDQKELNEVLEKQRDNNVYGIDEADRFWEKKRDE